MNSKARQPLPLVSDQMKAWSGALAAEIADWPRVSTRSFFGFTALYLGDQMVGILPRTRSFAKGNLLAFRLEDPCARVKARLENDPHIGVIDQNRTRWFTFELTRDTDLHDALDWLGVACQAADNRRKWKRRS